MRRHVRRIAVAGDIRGDADRARRWLESLEGQDVDAVVVGTPDHWHVPVTVDACAAGKHVYVEKPLCHNLREGLWLLDAARRTNRVVQHGTQQRSNRFTADAIQMLHEGLIGDVLAARVWNVQRRRDIGHLQPSDPPAEVDYDLWVGPARFEPFQANRFHYNWRWWHNFGSGDMGNDGVHELDYARWGLGVQQFPSRITAIGGKYFFDDDQQFPDTQTVLFEYDDPTALRGKRELVFEMRLWSTNYPENVDSGVEYYGTDGRMFLSKRGKLHVHGPRNRQIDKPRPKQPATLLAENHYADFIDAIRQNRPPQADVQTGLFSACLPNLGNLATRLGRTLHFDPVGHTIQDDAQATELLGRIYRQGGHWAIPSPARGA